MLTSSDLEMITIDFMKGVPIRVKGPEADDFVRKLAVDVEESKKNGWVVDLPFELPDIGGKDET